MNEKAKDDNARAQDGTLSDDPAAGTSAMAPDVEVHKATRKLVKDAVPAADLPLPNDAHAEAAVLSTLLWCGTNSPRTLSVSDVQDLLVSEDRFFSPAHQAIYKAMLTVHTSMQHTSVAAVHTRLRKWHQEKQAGGIEYLEKLVASAVPTSGQALRQLAEAVRDAWARRRVIALAGEINAEARRGKTNCDAIFEKAHTGLVDIASLLSAASSYISFASVAAEVMKGVSGGITDALPTGLYDLDDMTGGWYPQEVTIIAARTSVGKSALATQFAFAAVEGRPNEAVLYVSLEMPARQFVARIIAARAGVPLRHIRRKTVDESDHRKLVETSAAMKDTRVFFVDSQIQTIMSVSTIANRMNSALAMTGCRLALIVIDHIGLVKPSADSAKKPREQQVAETSRGLKYLSQQHRCHVFGLAQVGRDAEKQQGKSKVPELHHIRESGSIEQDAENILILHREREPGGKFKPNAPAKLHVAKARNDGLGHIWLAFEEQIGRFVPWADSKQAKSSAPDPHRNPSRQYVDPQSEDNK